MDPKVSLERESTSYAEVLTSFLSSFPVANRSVISGLLGSFGAIVENLPSWELLSTIVAIVETICSDKVSFLRTRPRFLSLLKHRLTGVSSSPGCSSPTPRRVFGLVHPLSIPRSSNQLPSTIFDHPPPPLPLHHLLDDLPHPSSTRPRRLYRSPSQRHHHPTHQLPSIPSSKPRRSSNSFRRRTPARMDQPRFLFPSRDRRSSLFGSTPHLPHRQNHSSNPPTQPFLNLHQSGVPRNSVEQARSVLAAGVREVVDRSELCRP